MELFRREDKLLEAQRLEQRTHYDIEMLREIGYCTGIENYSRYFDGRQPGQAPFTLLDYFPKDFLLFIDESHVTRPAGARACTTATSPANRRLVDYGFRLPSAFDNRPLRFQEFEQKIGQRIYVSATPGPYEMATRGAGGGADHPPHGADRPGNRRAPGARGRWTICWARSAR